ncbi:MAG: hypothetical protein CMF45_08230 [Legionellales bacterium]|nr:hypothetical protein [Legionellales bacterium]|tara:strand:+ start:801 stop:2303 length:1503 start_codon:yes stop_codon:yes gene_type:complete
MNKYFICIRIIVIIVCSFISYKPIFSEPWLPPGDMLIRSDLQLLHDFGVLQVPLTTWPLSLANIDAALDGADVSQAEYMVIQALQRVRDRIQEESSMGLSGVKSFIRGSSNPNIARTFEDTPRVKGEVGGGVSWMGQRFAIKAQGRRVSNPLDKDSFRPDGSYIGAAVGNWMLALGYPERWWGPGWDGSLILSTNVRPGPQFSIKRNITTPFNTKWLSWIGPWSLTTFFEQLNDERVIEDARLFGLRVTAMPVDGLEIGLSRTAQWCGVSRSCSASTFMDLLLGHDNEGVNVDMGQEPGNQLAGIDMRWNSPVGSAPYATYLQWIGEDTRQGGPQIGSWLRQFGIEFWGMMPGLNWQHRSHVEWADTMCREGGIGGGKKKPGCAYNHARYKTGYRYKGRSIGHGIDSDSRSSSIGSSVIDPYGNSMNFLARYMELNRSGMTYSQQSSMPSIPQDIVEFSVSYNRRVDFGTVSIGILYSDLRGNISDADTSFEWWFGFQTH